MSRMQDKDGLRDLVFRLGAMAVVIVVEVAEQLLGLVQLRENLGMRVVRGGGGRLGVTVRVRQAEDGEGAPDCDLQTCVHDWSP